MQNFNFGFFAEEEARIGASSFSVFCRIAASYIGLPPHAAFLFAGSGFLSTGFPVPCSL
jgi:hypothetical protein